MYVVKSIVSYVCMNVLFVFSTIGCVERRVSGVYLSLIGRELFIKNNTKQGSCSVVSVPERN